MENHNFDFPESINYGLVWVKVNYKYHLPQKAYPYLFLIKSYKGGKHFCLQIFLATFKSGFILP